MLVALDRHKPALLLITAAFALAIAGCGQTAQAPRCASDPLLGVYDPGRLEVLGACRWFSGTVRDVSTRDDGDLHIRLEPDPDMTGFLNVENVNTGGMVIEIMPGQSLRAPLVGEHVRVLGTWVLDSHNDWNEIHPLWAITYGDGSTQTALPPASPAYAGSGED